jgi:hypothetical protein
MSSTDERRPLLPPPTTGQGAPAPGPERDTHADGDEELPTDAAPSAPVARKLSLWVVLLYTVLTLAIIAGVAVIIKGFIDADDVEVCVCTLNALPVAHSIHVQFDLKKALKQALGGGLSGAAGESC